MRSPISETVATTMGRELEHLQNIVGLCAFAVEAKRICTASVRPRWIALSPRDAST